jgi:hypothetical protein
VPVATGEEGMPTAPHGALPGGLPAGLGEGLDRVGCLPVVREFVVAVAGGGVVRPSKPGPYLALTGAAGCGVAITVNKAGVDLLLDPAVAAEVAERHGMSLHDKSQETVSLRLRAVHLADPTLRSELTDLARTALQRSVRGRPVRPPRASRPSSSGAASGAQRTGRPAPAEPRFCPEHHVQLLPNGSCPEDW